MSGFFLMAGPGCCCECTAIVDDDYEIADDADYVPGGFTKVGGGTVGVVSGRLRITGTDTGIVTAAAYTLVRAAFQPSVSGTGVVVRFVFAFVDLDNYHCVELRHDGSFWRILVIERLAAVETTVREEFYAQVVPTGDTPNRFITFPQAVTLRYNAATGWLFVTNPEGTPVVDSGWLVVHKFETPPAAGKVGMIAGDANPGFLDDARTILTVASTDCAIASSPSEECAGLVVYGCNQDISEFVDEIELSIADIPAGAPVLPKTCDGSGLIGTYVLTRRQDIPFSDYPHNISVLGANTDYGQQGFPYEYTLPAAICSIKYIQVWWGAGNPGVGGGRSVMVDFLDAGRAFVWRHFLSFDVDDTQIAENPGPDSEVTYTSSCKHCNVMTISSVVDYTPGDNVAGIPSYDNTAQTTSVTP